MDNSTVGLPTDQFAKLTDPRTGHAERHKLTDVFIIAVCAVVCCGVGPAFFTLRDSGTAGPSGVFCTRQSSMGRLSRHRVTKRKE